MTEAEWVESADIQHRFCWAIDGGWVSDRKLRLFVCALARDLWPDLADDRTRRAVEVGERFADGRTTVPELTAARAAARQSKRDARHNFPRGELWKAAALDIRWAVESLIKMIDRPRQAAVLWEVIGPPLLRPVYFKNVVRAWASGPVGEMARDIYERSCFELMPVLGAALSDAGCVDPIILGYCGANQKHYKGCWVVDLLLNQA